MEFDLIHRHFKVPFANLVGSAKGSVVAGIGDDCAALRPDADSVLYVSTDTLVENVHFFCDDSAERVGHKSLACNLSDLAACGATPLGFTLNLSLPSVDEAWLSGFSTGMLALATQYHCPLVGGDTTSAGRNRLKTLSITVFGQAPSGHSGFHRAHAKAGDELWVSGTPGLARLGLLLEYQRRGLLATQCKPDQLAGVEHLLAQLPDLVRNKSLHALQMPQPRLALGHSLRGVANACVDLSDGLSGDVSHIAQASQLAVHVSAQSLETIWMSVWPSLAQRSDAKQLLDTLVCISLQGGDDFELCWTSRPGTTNALQSSQVPIHRIGSTASGSGVWLQLADNSLSQLQSQSYNHFSESLL